MNESQCNEWMISNEYMVFGSWDGDDEEHKMEERNRNSERVKQGESSDEGWGRRCRWVQMSDDRVSVQLFFIVSRTRSYDSNIIKCRIEFESVTALHEEPSSCCSPNCRIGEWHGSDHENASPSPPEWMNDYWWWLKKRNGWIRLRIMTMLWCQCVDRERMYFLFGCLPWIIIWLMMNIFPPPTIIFGCFQNSIQFFSILIPLSPSLPASYATQRLSSFLFFSRVVSFPLIS